MKREGANLPFSHLETMNVYCSPNGYFLRRPSSMMISTSTIIITTRYSILSSLIYTSIVSFRACALFIISSCSTYSTNWYYNDYFLLVNSPKILKNRIFLKFLKLSFIIFKECYLLVYFL